MRCLFLLMIVLTSFQFYSYTSHAMAPAQTKFNTNKQSLFFLQDSLYAQQTQLNFQKPRKKGIGLILGGIVLLVLGFIFGVTLLLFFLFGFSIGQSFYFQDIYLTAGIMLTGLGIFGLGVFMLTRGLERWRTYREYIKKLKNTKQ